MGDDGEIFESPSLRTTVFIIFIHCYVLDPVSHLLSLVDFIVHDLSIYLCRDLSVFIWHFSRCYQCASQHLMGFPSFLTAIRRLPVHFPKASEFWEQFTR